MKILLLSKTYYPNSYGGIEKFIEQLTYVNGKKYSLTICSIHNQNTIKSKKINNIHLLYYPKTFELSSNSFSLKLLFNFKKIANEHDLIIYNYPWPFQDLLSFLTNKKYIVVYHSDIVRQKILKYVYYFFIRSKFLKNASSVIFTTNTYWKITDCPKNILQNYQIINLGIKNYELQNTKTKFNDYILFIGVLRKYKAIDALIKISNITKKRIVIIGKSKDYSQKTFKNSKYISYLGEVSESTKYNYLQNCKFLILPSNQKSEAFGIVLLEAISLKKPLIVNKNNTGTKEVCINNYNGYMVDFKKTSTLKKKIISLYENKKVYNKFCNNSYALYLKKFTHKMMIDRYINVFKSLELEK